MVRRTAQHVMRVSCKSEVKHFADMRAQRSGIEHRGEFVQTLRRNVDEKEQRANADRERTVILADAQRNAQKLRGEGDSQAIEIYAKAYDQDKGFFTFYRSLQAYRDAFANSSTSFVLNPSSSFFRYFESPNGTPTSAAPAKPVSPAAKAGVP